MANQSFFDKLAEVANTAGNLARQSVDTARKIYKDLEPTLNTALDYAKTVTDKERRDQAVAQLTAVGNRVLASGSSQLKYVMTQMQEGFNGVPSQVAAVIATYGTLAEAAEAKGALGLPEMIACSAQIEVIKKTLADKPQADVKADGEKLEQLVRTAGAAVANFASDEPSVRRLLISCQSTVSDIIFAEDERVAALGQYVINIKDATAPEPISGLPSIADLQTRITDAEADITAASFPAAAIKLSNFSVDASAVLSATQAQATSLKDLADYPARTRRFLTTLVSRAQALDKLTVTADSTAEQKESARALLEAARTAKDLLKAVPCDRNAAQDAVDLFETLAR